MKKYERQFIKRYSYKDYIETICFYLTDCARKYIKLSRNATKNIHDNLRNAILIDAINYVGMRSGCDFGLDVNYLEDQINEGYEVPVKYLLNISFKEFGNYLAQESIEKSVIEHRDLTNYKFGFDESYGEIVLFDFIRFIANELHEEEVYDVEDALEELNLDLLRRKYHEQDDVIRYQERLDSGETLEHIFNTEVEYMITAYLKTRNDPDDIYNGFLKQRILYLKAQRNKDNYND